MCSSTEPIADEQSKPEPAPTWYAYGGTAKGRIFGNMYFHAAFSVVYACAAIAPIVWFLHEPVSLKQWINSIAVLPWVLFASLAYPLWVWLEARAFEKWVRNKPTNLRAIERAYFKLMADSAKNFWAALLAIYAVGGLLGIAFKAL
jgi:hypothetical protein